MKFYCFATFEKKLCCEGRITNMAKYYENSTVFHYNYEQVLQGFWKRYPNPFSNHVLTEDTVERHIRPDGTLYSKRVLTKTNPVPKWGERFFKAKFVCIIEESIVDPKSKTLTTHTRNIGFNKIMVCYIILPLSDCSHYHFDLILERRRESCLSIRCSQQHHCRLSICLDRLSCVWIRYCDSSIWL